MVDPFTTETSLSNNIQKVKKFDPTEYLYPSKIMDPIIDELMSGKHEGRIRPPKFVFLPSVKLIRKVAKMILKNG